MTKLSRRIPGKILCLVTDLERAGSEPDMVRIVREAVSGGVNMVQVRAHELNPESLRELTAAVVKEVGDDAFVTVNGSPEVAESSGALGVHLRESSQIDRSLLRPETMVGQSIHSLKGALAADATDVDYIVLGTVFPSASHPGGATGGTELVQRVSSKISVPIIAIGGITAENAAQVMVAGASGIAVISAIIGAPNPFEAAKALARAINLPDPTNVNQVDHD